ncbi:hypothetical protein SALBM217S_02677 [Streptomyces griseoloalbus]
MSPESPTALMTGLILNCPDKKGACGGQHGIPSHVLPLTPTACAYYRFRVLERTHHAITRYVATASMRCQAALEAGGDIAVGLAGSRSMPSTHVPVGVSTRPSVNSIARRQGAASPSPGRTRGAVVHAQQGAIAGLLLPAAAARAELEARRVPGGVVLVVRPESRPRPGGCEVAKPSSQSWRSAGGRWRAGRKSCGREAAERGRRRRRTAAGAGCRRPCPLPETSVRRTSSGALRRWCGPRRRSRRCRLAAGRRTPSTGATATTAAWSSVRCTRMRPRTGRTAWCRPRRLRRRRRRLRNAGDEPPEVAAGRGSTGPRRAVPAGRRACERTGRGAAASTFGVLAAGPCRPEQAGRIGQQAAGDDRCGAAAEPARSWRACRRRSAGR